MNSVTYALLKTRETELKMCYHFLLWMRLSLITGYLISPKTLLRILVKFVDKTLFSFYPNINSWICIEEYQKHFIAIFFKKKF